MRGRGSLLRAALCVAVVLIAARASDVQGSDIPRIGYLSGGAQINAGFVRGLREAGWRESENIAIEFRSAGGQASKLAKLAEELARLKVDVILTPGIDATNAARQATTSTPIVCLTGDPVAAGFVESLARPGGRITGLAWQTTGLSVKWLELIKEIAPKASRVAVLADSQAGAHITRKAMDDAARTLGLDLVRLQLQAPDEPEAAFEEARRQRAGAIVVHGSPGLNAQRRRIVDLVARSRLPAVYESPSFPAAGGLMSYGPDHGVGFHRAATFVDRILRGARPADLPVEQVSKFLLVINARTAKALGVIIPPSLLARADEVLQ